MPDASQARWKQGLFPGAVLLGCSALLVAKGLNTISSTWLETWGSITGAICVMLVVLRSIWNFPIGIISCALYCWFFYDGRLFGEAGLQLVFITLSLHGWWAWGRGLMIDKPIRQVPLLELSILASLFPIVWLILIEVLMSVNGAAPVVDGFVAALSLFAQYLLNRRYIESWLGWIIVDQVSVVLFWSRGYQLTAGLYALFLVMCVLGWWEWRKQLAERSG